MSVFSPSSHAAEVAGAIREMCQALYEAQSGRADIADENATYLTDLICVLRDRPIAFCNALIEHLLEQRAEWWRKAGRCEWCGAELEERRWREAHGEPWRALVCPEHGEVAAGADRLG